MSDFRNKAIFESVPEPTSEPASKPPSDFSRRKEAAANRLDKDRDATVKRLEQALVRHKEYSIEELENLLWDTLALFQGYPFYTAKKLEFTYSLKGYEMFVSRKEKSLTKASVMLAFRKALELERVVSGPKKLGTFGASYLYPVFLRLGVIFRM